jgi:hypothetical protein
MENKANRMANKNAQADRAALARKVAKEMGGDVRDVAVAKEVQRRQEAMAQRATAEQAKKDTSPRRRKTTAEYKAVAVQLFNLHKNARRKAREAEQELKSVEKETKGDNSREARLKRSTAEKAFMKADSNEERALRAAVKANSSYVKLHRKDELAKMSPQQKAAEKEIDKIIQERG